jgi:hypothetical protein
MIRIDQRPDYFASMTESMKVTYEIALGRRCPTCGAKPGEQCELGTGQPRTYIHDNRPKLRPPQGGEISATF